METIEELAEFIQKASRDNVRGRLLARGEARATVRRQGVLPNDAPPFGETLDTDLSEYGFSLLRACLALKEQNGPQSTWRSGLIRAGNAFESLVRNGSPDSLCRGFWRIMGSAAYHMAGYSAMAFSLLKQRENEANFSPGEVALVRLILRDLRSLKEEAMAWLRNPLHRDDVLVTALSKGDIDMDEVISSVLTTTIYRAFSFFDFALASGASSQHENAIELLRRGMQVARRSGAVPLWWLLRVALNLVDDLWASSLHTMLPQSGPDNSPGYSVNRSVFLASLYSRDVAEIELWPSQIEAASRVCDANDDLVVALPTSAGKTRIAELCALICLSSTKRVLIVTPLRALSAQTERSFRKTFAPMGFSVSSLYGASGVAAGDGDALRSRDIVIATPEKLDFALRTDPALIDDVGLVVLDEGHLIGPNERELRYEILVQRLLRREDSHDRRIVCLSAILPDGNQLDDLTAWMRSDVAGNPVKSNWRPTRQRFGTLTWNGSAAMLAFDLEENGPYILDFVEKTPAIFPRKTPFPKDNAELTLAAAWRFADEGKRVLIYCTQRDHVESYAKKVVDLAKRGFLQSLLLDEHAVERAKVVGAEWLGTDHPAVTCLDVGVAIHHGRLPGPFLRELERLLNEGVIRVTVASPTLAQGLNLNAAVLLVPSLYRAAEPLKGEEFANVAGRAGRAFVDLEGLIVHVMFEPKVWRRRAWRSLVTSAKARSIESGLIQISTHILDRLARSGILKRENAFEYLANTHKAWKIKEEIQEGEEPFELLLEKLDNVILGLIDALDADASDLPRLIDEALNGSLWARQIVHRAEGEREAQINLFRARSKLVWKLTSAEQRRGHFAMGVGLEAGLALDAMADELAASLDAADDASLSGNIKVLQASLIMLGKRLLSIRPFAPDEPLPGEWPEILTNWIRGKSIQEIGPDNLRYIEEAFAYRLVWAIEALRVRRVALGWEAEIVTGGAAACLETGVPGFIAAMLVRSGLPSRVAAITVVDELRPTVLTNSELLQWLRSEEVKAFSEIPDWPTPETVDIWRRFRDEALTGIGQKWTTREWNRSVDAKTFRGEYENGAPHRVEIDGLDTWICTPDFNRIVKLRRPIVDRGPSVYTATFSDDKAITVRRIGRGAPLWRDRLR